ncbi:SH3 domain containing protein [Tritrichomonas foetus]|uniref:SH3 domain containing protein n=1 Tax=Tritrichomonas foetus TaxID=1144522 RepID=A0A1J4J8V8_9EUKA|nr:SH3 domain containing protein [Tritrichomonas foetus]|eukprot:OHS93837.1 SH3 domain containing protein [Tritrichomonas foetus]
MSRWERYTASAVAVYPYSSNQEFHLMLQSGDQLEITEKMGDWIKAKCKTTSCIGICPINRVAILNDTNNTDETKPFDLLIHDAQSLLSHVFLRHLVPTRHPNEEDMHIINLVTKIQAFLKMTPQDRCQIAECLDEIRRKLGFPSRARRSDFSVLRTHDINDNVNYTSELRTEKNKTKSNFTQQAHISVNFELNYKEDLRLSFSLFDSLKKETISAPADIFVAANTDSIKQFKFLNIDASCLPNLVLIIRALSFIQFGEKKNGPWASEYVGVGAEKLTFGGGEKNINYPFYRLTEGSQSEIPDLLLSGNPESSKVLFRNDDLPYMKITYSSQESAEPALTPKAENEIPTMKYPINITPTFSINKLYVKLNMLHHKTKLKRTRVLLHLLDLSTGIFVDCFSKTHDKTFYPTIVQKGSVDMPIFEVAGINLNANFDIQNSYLIFEVQRLSRSRGDIHLSSYAIYRLTEDDGTFNFTQNANKTLTLLKPPQPQMDTQDYVSLISSSSQKSSSGTGGELTISLIISSTIMPCDHIIYYILNWKENKEKILSESYDPKQIDDVDFMVFVPQLLTKSIEMMLSENESNNQSNIPSNNDSNNKTISNYALELIVQLLSKIDQSRSAQLKYYFDCFIENMFTTEHPEYANIYKYLINYIINTLPADATTEFTPQDIERCKMCCRCLSYILSILSASLGLSKELQNEVDDKTFQDSVRNIFVRLGTIVQHTSNQISISKSFICRSFPMLCDIIRGSFSQEESVQLVMNFFEAVQKDKIVGNMQRLISGITETHFFSIESNRTKLLPIIINNLTKGEKFQQDVFPLVKTIFFVIMKSTSYFQKAISPLAVFLDKFIVKNAQITGNEYYYYFGLILLYFCDDQAIKKKILDSEDKLDFFNSMLDLIHQIVISSPPSYLFYICTITFIKIVSFTTNHEFTFVHTHLDRLIGVVSGFYNSFLKKSMSAAIPECDKKFFSRVYITDLLPIAALLPELLKSVPEESRFNASVILPLFHFYVNQPSPQARNLVAEGFFQLMESDWKQTKSFTRSENASIHALDQVSSYPNMLDLKQLFTNTLTKFGEKRTNVVIDKFFKRLEQLTTFMRDLGSFPNERLYEDERSTAILSILDACRNNNDFMMFPHFTSKLYELHMMMGNKTEAAEALMECANIFSWDDKTIVAEGHGQPEQEKCDRKREIMHTAVDLFMQSNFYERALEVLTSLQQYYKDISIDYAELAKIYQKESECYEAICNQERNILNRFYGVRFYGNSFNEYFKDSLFVYRRDGFFMNDQMMRDLKEKFPDANVQPKPPSEEDLKNPDLLYIHVFNMTPRDVEGFDYLTPPSDLMVKSVCGIDSFYSKTPIRKRREGNYGEFAEWHRHIFKYKTKRPLQGLVRRLQVVETSPLIELSPIECAIIDTNEKTIELMQKASMYWRCLRYNLKFNQVAVSSFSMLMSGIVNAAVNGGTKVFQELFLESDLKNEPINKKHSQNLKNAFADQLKAVHFALEVHSRVMSEQYAALHQNIIESFADMRSSMEKALGPVDLNEQPTFGTIPPVDFFKDLKAC